MKKNEISKITKTNIERDSDSEIIHNDDDGFGEVDDENNIIYDKSETNSKEKSFSIFNKVDINISQSIKGDEDLDFTKVLKTYMQAYDKNIKLNDIQKQAIIEYFKTNEIQKQIRKYYENDNEIFNDLKVVTFNEALRIPYGFGKQQIWYNVRGKDINNMWVRYNKKGEIKNIAFIDATSLCGDTFITIDLVYEKRKISGQLEEFYGEIHFENFISPYGLMPNEIDKNIYVIPLKGVLCDKDGKTRVTVKHKDNGSVRESTLLYYDQNGHVFKKIYFVKSGRETIDKGVFFSNFGNSEVISKPQLMLKMYSTNKHGYYYLAKDKNHNKISYDKAGVACVLLRIGKAGRSYEYYKDKYGEKNVVSLSEEDFDENGIKEKKTKKIIDLINNSNKKEIKVILNVHGSDNLTLHEDGEVKILLDFIAKVCRKHQHIYIKNNSCFAATKIKDKQQKNVKKDKLNLYEEINKKFYDKDVFYTEIATKKIPTNTRNDVPRKRFIKNANSTLEEIKVDKLTEEDWKTYGKEDAKYVIHDQRLYMPIFTAKDLAITEAQKRIQKAKRLKLMNTPIENKKHRSTNECCCCGS